MTFTDKLAAAKSAPRPTRDVTVALDAAVEARRKELSDELDAARDNDDPRLAAGRNPAELQQQIDALEAEYAQALVVIRFTRLPGQEWAELTLKNPGRPDVIADTVVGNYNVHAVTRAAAVASGVIVDGDDEYQPTPDEWNDLFDTISGFEFGNVVDTVYSLNQADAQQAIEIAGKALAAIQDSGRMSLPQ
ncbi:hypothetical protein HUN59_14840 [Curtobacterium sp. Csp2]|uniref:hypothetical protein n=1 Tax=Curtobacterium sp. Csp2 TaxID=2495430 RepID=UPI0015811718|nr:hypothetical protein [Curtobacterium sp. Csp2]QKS17317.1 hypothetical protein HUN59_14840 [Curtobacterium sp. Csp2]